MNIVQIKDLYSPTDMDDEEEVLFHELDEESIHGCFEVETLAPSQLTEIKTHQGDVTVMEAYHLYADEDQRALVRDIMFNFDADRVIVLRGDRVIDGNHHIVAAVTLGSEVFAIDLDKVMDPDIQPAPAQHRDQGASTAP